MSLEELRRVAEMLVAPGKGILAIDESTNTIKKRFDAVGIASTEESRRAYREMLLTAPGLGDYISGAIVFDETIRQSTKAGVPFTDVMQDAGILPGIKVDRGPHALAGFPGELVTEGLDGLRERFAEYVELGARFAKWRTVLTIGEDTPSATCIDANAHTLARYAALCQEAGLVAIVEPEVLMDGGHDLDVSYEVTEAVLRALFLALYEHDVLLEGTILKASMVLSGRDSPTQSGVEEVAAATVRCLRAAAPASLPGIVFLSGGQSDERATAHLRAMNRLGPHPWPLSFSFGRALQRTALTLFGRDLQHNSAAAQQALLSRAKENALAALGLGNEQARPDPAPARNDDAFAVKTRRLRTGARHASPH